jgi:hypothetical protein
LENFIGSASDGQAKGELLRKSVATEPNSLLF